MPGPIFIHLSTFGAEDGDIVFQDGGDEDSQWQPQVYVSASFMQFFQQASPSSWIFQEMCDYNLEPISRSISLDIQLLAQAGYRLTSQTHIERQTL